MKKSLSLLILSLLIAAFLLAACQAQKETGPPEQLLQPAPEQVTETIEEPSAPKVEPEVPPVTETDNNSPPYLIGDELIYRGFTIGETTIQDLQDTLGKPVEITQREVTEFPYAGIIVYEYIYDDAKYMFLLHPDKDADKPLTLYLISFDKHTDYPTPRGINIGDAQEDVLSKFPQEPVAIGGSLMIIETPNRRELYIMFEDGIVTYISIGYCD